MNFLKYILLCIAEAITDGLGRSDLTNKDNKMGWIGLACVFVICGFNVICMLFIYKKSKHFLLYSILTTIGFIIIFCILSILIEYLINL